MQPGYPITVGRYEILRPLAEGGFGQVYLARMAGAAGFHRIVAIKRIRREHTSSPEFVRDFIKEARIGGYLQHHHVVQVLGFEEIDGNYLLVMEFVDGVGLEAIIHLAKITQKPIPPAVVAEIMAQAAEGMQYIHTLNDPNGTPLDLVHRDIKPSNLLVSRAGLVKITDFGIARAAIEVGKQTAAGLIKGTLNYLSPEQARGENIDHRSDIYSLGAILYEMLTHNRLWDEDNPWVLLGKLGYNELGNRLETLPEHVEQFGPLLRRLLTANPDERIQNAGELAEELFNLKRTYAQPGQTLARLLPGWIDEIQIRRGEYDAESAPTRAAAAGDDFIHKPDPFDALNPTALNSTERRAPTETFAKQAPSSNIGQTRVVSDESVPRPAGTVSASQPNVKGGGTSGAAASPAGEPVAVPTPAAPDGLGSTGSRPSVPLVPVVVGVLLLLAVGVFFWRAPQEQVVNEADQPPTAAPSARTEAPVAVATAAPAAPTSAPVAPTLAESQPSTDKPGTDKPAGGKQPADKQVAARPNGKEVEVPPTPEKTPVPVKPSEKTTEKTTEKAPEKPAEKVPEVAPEAPAVEAPGKLVVTSRPAAVVFIDGKAGGETPIRGLELPPGSYTLKLSRPDMNFQQTVEVKVRSGATSRVTCTTDGCDVL